MRPVYVVGAGMTRFGRSEWPLVDLAATSSLAALHHANLGKIPVDAVVVANMGGGRVNRQTALGSALVDRLSMWPAAAEAVENGPASGASAVKVGYQAIASGMADVVLVTGVEMMRAVDGLEATDFVASLAHPEVEYIYGVTLPSLAGLFARLFMARHGVERRHLALVAIKNHENAMKNPYAHIHQPVTMEGILTAPEAIVNNPPVAEPLHMFDCCPVSDGAASLLLASQDVAAKLGAPRVVIAGIGQATDTHAVQEREDPTDLKAVRLASVAAFEAAGAKPADVDVAELHDAFTILEIAESEAAGFFKAGQAHKALERGETQLTGKLPINPSGGLKAKGHPVGATGVAQLVELTWQLRGEAAGRQIAGAKLAYACNFGGFGNNVVATVLRKEER
ncbi:MAG: acetyl-CoA acetyltransferase [Candidatus Bipolaricaulota bacterium]